MQRHPYEWPSLAENQWPNHGRQLTRMQRLIGQVTDCFRSYEFAAARNEVEVFFWKVLADNYLEMCKLPLYEENSEGARCALHRVLLTILKLFAPFMPYVTEEIYRALFAGGDGSASIHRADWPTADKALVDEVGEAAGDVIVDVATAVRRYKTENQLHLSAELGRLQVAVGDADLRRVLSQAKADIRSITRAKRVEIREQPDDDLKRIEDADGIAVSLTA